MNIQLCRVFIVIIIMGGVVFCPSRVTAQDSIPSDPKTTPTGKSAEDTSRTERYVQSQIDRMNARITLPQHSTAPTHSGDEKWLYNTHPDAHLDPDASAPRNLQVVVDDTGLVAIEGDFVNNYIVRITYYSGLTAPGSNYGVGARFYTPNVVPGEPVSRYSAFQSSALNRLYYSIQNYGLSQHGSSFTVDDQNQRFRFTYQYASINDVPDNLSFTFRDIDDATSRITNHAMVYNVSNRVPFSSGIPTRANRSDSNLSNPTTSRIAHNSNSLTGAINSGRNAGSSRSNHRAVSGPAFLLKNSDKVLNAFNSDASPKVITHSPLRHFIKKGFERGPLQRPISFVRFNFSAPALPKPGTKRTLTLHVESQSKEVTQLIENFIKENQVDFEVVQIIMKALSGFEETAYQAYLMNLRPYYTKLAEMLKPIVEQLGETLPVAPQMDSSLVTEAEITWMQAMDELASMVVEMDEELGQYGPEIRDAIRRIRSFQHDFHENTLNDLEKAYERRVHDSLIQFLEELKEMIEKKEVAHLKEKGNVVEIILKPHIAR